MPISSKVRAVNNALRVQGLAGFIRVLLEKKDKRQRYSKMLKELPQTTSLAILNDQTIGEIVVTEVKKEIIAKADAMLRDENSYFTFPYKLRGIERPWNYDPFEQLYWPARHYTEQKLHAEDTPHDVKIVWEINRFKDLPTLAQAAYLTGDKRYADEVEWRLLSWIDDNPFIESINWASGLEIAIRLISWTASLLLLRAAGFDLSRNGRIARSIYEQAVYLRADLSTDKIVRSNHLIGEVAGLFFISNVWTFPGCEEYSTTARAILEEEIVRQTYHDGATRESTTWYHGFVTDFFDIASRTHHLGKPFSVAFLQRLALMKSFREQTIQPDGTPVRIGDADDGYALYFEGESERWFDAIFGSAMNSAKTHATFDTLGYLFRNDGENAIYIRGGEFGMGGDGSSSHAHDDLLAPAAWLGGLPVLVDPGTYVYNGAAKYRSRYRSEHSHNTFSLNEGSRAKQRLNFGWYETRKPASMKLIGNGPIEILGQYAEWPDHKRTVRLADNIEIVDEVLNHQSRAAARLHLHPMWKPVGEREFATDDGRRLYLEVNGWEKVTLETYDFSPSYRVQVPATKIILRSEPVSGKLRVVLRVD